jgi:hypothetical protein
MADFAELRMTWEGRNARYRNLTSAINNFTSDALDVSARFALEKFLPESWGVGLPLTVDHFGRDDAPLYRVGSDVLLSDDSDRDAQARTSDFTVVTLRAFRARQSSIPPSPRRWTVSRPGHLAGVGGGRPGLQRGQCDRDLIGTARKRASAGTSWLANLLAGGDRPAARFRARGRD